MKLNHAGKQTIFNIHITVMKFLLIIIIVDLFEIAGREFRFKTENKTPKKAKSGDEVGDVEHMLEKYST